MKSVHTFKPGDHVAYSVTLAAVPEKGLRKRHLQGVGVVIQKFAAGNYEIVIKSGAHKVFYPQELRKL